MFLKCEIERWFPQGDSMWKEGDTRLINAKMNSSALSDIGRDDNFSYHDYDSYVGLC